MEILRVLFAMEVGFCRVRVSGVGAFWARVCEQLQNRGTPALSAED